MKFKLTDAYINDNEVLSFAVLRRNYIVTWNSVMMGQWIYALNTHKKFTLKNNF